MRQRNIIFSIVGILLLFAFVGCSEESEPATGSANVTMDFSALSSADVVRIELKVYSSVAAYNNGNPNENQPGFPVSVTYTGGSGDNWNGTVEDIPLGAGRIFVAEAYDAGTGGNLIYYGKFSPVEITDTPVSVTIIMLSNEPSEEFDNTVPKILGLSVSQAVITVGEHLTFTYSATDADNDVLNYTLGVGDGAGHYGTLSALADSGSDPYNFTETWDWTSDTAGFFTITIGVSDGQGGTDSAVFTSVIQVIATGSANVAMVLNDPPTVTLLAVSNAQISVGQSLIMTVNTSDPNGDPITSYSFSRSIAYSCDGAFTAASGNTVTFTLSAEDPVNHLCELQVTVSDGKGGIGHGNVTIFTGPDNVPVSYE